MFRHTCLNCEVTTGTLTVIEFGEESECGDLRKGAASDEEHQRRFRVVHVRAVDAVSGIPCSNHQTSRNSLKISTKKNLKFELTPPAQVDGQRLRLLDQLTRQ